MLSRDGLKSWCATLALSIIVLSAAGLALVWVFRVPIYQSPDEPQHLDFALCIYEKGGLIRVPPQDLRSTEFSHPYTAYLVERVHTAEIAFHPGAKVPLDYGSQPFYEALDRDAPAWDACQVRQPPALLTVYPFGYYALLALWIELLHGFDEGLVFTFFGARIFSVLLLVCSLVLTYTTLREMSFRRGFSLLLIACIGFFPMTTFVASYVQPDNLSFTLVSLCFYLTALVRRQPRAWLCGLLGLAFGALLVTKPHYWLCVLVPALGLFFSDVIHQREAPRRWLGRAALLILPSVLLGAVYLWTVWGTTNYYAAPASDADLTLQVINRLKIAFMNYYAGPTHDTFWGVFGWTDAPLRIGSPRTHAVIQALLQGLTWVFLALTLWRLEQVVSRLGSLARRGRLTQAVRLACSNVPINSYFLFTVFMFFLYVRLDNRFGAQGRNWLPFLLPIFLTGLVYAPKALTLRRVRGAFSTVMATALLSYALVGSYYALETINKRYYLPIHGRPVQEAPLAIEPVALQQMTWCEGVAIGEGADAYLVFNLEKPAWVYGVQIRYVLTNPEDAPAVFQAFWRETAANHFVATERNWLQQVPTGPEERTLTIWIDERIDQLRLDPDNKPCSFRIREIKLLLKPEED